MNYSKLITILVFVLLISEVNAQKAIDVLVFSKTSGWRHKSIETGQEQIKKWGAKENWKVRLTEKTADISNANLKDVEVLIFLNTTLEVLDKDSREALKKYINNGGGFVGIHSATDTEYNWPWYHQMIGAQFINHPKTQTATMDVNHTCNHPSIKHFEDTFTVKDEWYNFKDEVLPRVNVLLTLDESSYEGKQMEKNHPIAWYQYYEGGRIFYTGMGHTKEIFFNPVYIKHVVAGVNWAASRTNVEMNKDWEDLLDTSLSKWDKFMGVPHISVDLDGIEKSKDGKTGTPLGVNNDPKNVFSTIKENGETVLHITGEIYGGLTSKEEYSNYHFKAQFKWGEKKWAPRLSSKRDNGILYHCNGPHGAFWNVWMSSLECQIQEGDCGDFIALNDVYGDVTVDKLLRENGKPYFVYNPKGKLTPLKWAEGFEDGQASKSKLYENPNGEWNTIEIICVGRTSMHVVNGHVVNVIKNARYDIGGKTTPIESGKIQIQSEAAESYYKNIQIKPINKFPRKYKKQAKL
ncbi:ThuA domain-containing protein [Lutibacter citreus]|uniref:ThuA domain-containing protein n=1 Tax=Lutibacter citreus TaxID=2138210 RepID=UPI001FE3CD2A|nr:ThuA domain-containing protein [Lutibacter citreus]